ncbi:MAG: PepSY domain-containing protein [Eubacterium sp.]|nr:PepSY domain-containing protein [Eubacterium sp.]
MMNRKINCAVLIAALSLTVLAGCGNDSVTGQASDTGVSASTAAAADIITLDGAKAAALSHAGLSESDVTFVKTKLDRDGGMDEYDIEFTANGFKYEYEIDAVSGRILEFSSETVSDSRTGTAASSADGSEQITLDEAKAIALKHAGVSESAAVFTEAKLDRGGGVSEYDIEFTADNAEYEYEIDAASGKIVSDKVKYYYEAATDRVKVTESPAQTTTAQATTKPAVHTTTKAAASGQITLDEAKAIALKHAGVDASAAVFTKAKLDYDDGIAEYDIEFVANNIEYEYEIGAADGAVLESSFEKVKQVMAEAASGQITLDEAKAIALKHAGVSESAAVFTKAKQERDDGIVKYDIEFVADNTEYEYEISAADGTVLESSVEKRKQADTSASGQITLDEAKAIALEHAGFKEDQVRFTKSKLDRDDGVDEYEIEFKANGVEYEYKINASTGKIIEYDVDRD